MSLLQSAQYIQTLQERQNIHIGCPEEIALKKGFITKKHFIKISKKFAKNSYGTYLKSILKKY